MLGEDLLRAPATASRIDNRIFRPSFRTVGPDCYELTSQAATADAAIAELRALGVETPTGLVPRLVEAKHNPAAWTRDDPDQKYAVTRPSIVRRWVFDLAAAGGRDIGALVKHVLRYKAPKRSAAGVGGAFVVCLADLQLGKVDAQGGTAGTIDRALNKLAEAVNVARRVKPAMIVLADVGDGVENFDNHAGQPYSNDLSLPQQIDTFQAITTRAALDLAEVAPVSFVSVPSNHCQWRRGGRASAGTPGDDWGINNARALSRIFTTAGREDITVIIPETYAESLALDIDGLTVAFAHGHQASSPDKLADWWRGQAFGDGPAAGARLAVFGHWHSLRVQSVGNGKTLMVCPTLDPGSSWYTNLSGEESAPGLLTFVVRQGSWDQLKIL